MNLYELALYRAMEGESGGDPSVTVEPLTVTENGEYSEEGKAYSPVTVNVPDPILAPVTIVNNTGGVMTLRDLSIVQADGKLIVDSTVSVSTGGNATLYGSCYSMNRRNSCRFCTQVNIRKSVLPSVDRINVSLNNSSSSVAIVNVPSLDNSTYWGFLMGINHYDDTPLVITFSITS